MPSGRFLRSMIHLLGSLPVVWPARPSLSALAGTRAYGARGERMSATLEGVVRLPLPSGSLVRVRAQFLDNLVVQTKDEERWRPLPDKQTLRLFAEGLQDSFLVPVRVALIVMDLLRRLEPLRMPR